MKKMMWILIVVSFIAGTFTSAAIADVTAQDVSLLPKINEILKNQETILKELAQIKEELAVIKVRATLQ